MQISVTVEIMAVKFRPLNSFEWAVLSALSAFPDSPPSLVEVSRQLNLHEPTFLKVALDAMRRDLATEPRTDVGNGFDLGEFKLTDFGRVALQNDGWEEGDEETIRCEFTLEWPAAKIVSPISDNRSAKKHKQAAPTPEEVTKRLSLAQVEAELNAQPSVVWRAKDFYVTKVEL